MGCQLPLSPSALSGKAAQQLCFAFETLEVLSAVGTVRAGKGHDAGGLTCELLRVALLGFDAEEPQAGTVPVVPDVPSTGPASAALLDCLTQLLNSVRQAGPYPPTMAVGKLVPVPKKGCQAEDKGTYRGICVQSVLGQLVDCVLYARAGPYIEQADLRAPVQCGFRQGYGTLDALFTMQHLISRHYQEGVACMLCCFQQGV